jgi:trigger factor
MKVEVQNLSNVEVKVVAEIPAEQVESEVQKRLREIARTVNVRGFRKGKAPIKLIEARLGEQVRAEAAQGLFEDNVAAILEQAGATPLGEPELEVGEVQSGQPLTFTFTYEVPPTFEPQGYKDLGLTWTDPTVEDEEVAADLEQIRERRAEFVPLEDDATADTGVQVTLNYEGFMNGEAVEEIKGEGLDILIGAGRFIPGFEDALMGVKAGEEREFELKFPDDYGFEKVAGKEVRFQVKVQELKRKVLPALDDELATDEGAENLDELRAKRREHLLTAKRAEAEKARDDALTNALVERNPIDLPPKALAAREQAMFVQYAEMWKRFGLDDKAVQEMLANEDLSFHDEAAKAMRKWFIVDRIAEVEGIEVSDEDLDFALARMADSQGQPLGKLRAWLQKDDNEERFRAQLKRESVIELLLKWNFGDGDAAEAASLDDASADRGAADRGAADRGGVRTDESAELDPHGHRADPPRRTRVEHLLAPHARPDHLPGHANPRRAGQRGHRPAPVPGVGGS